jgi:hypothetical protein
MKGDTFSFPHELDRKSHNQMLIGSKCCPSLALFAAGAFMREEVETSSV